MIITRKIPLVITSNDLEEAYAFLRSEIYHFYRALNYAMNHVYFNYVAKEKIKFADEKYAKREKKYIEGIQKARENMKHAKTVKQEEKAKKSLESNKKSLEKLRKSASKEANKTFSKIIACSELTNTADAVKAAFPMLSRDSIDFAANKASTDFKNDLKQGLLLGDRTLRTYKKGHPLLVRGRNLKFTKSDRDYHIRFVKGIMFKCALKHKKINQNEISRTLDKVIDGSYKICDSSIEFQGKKLFLNLTLEMDVTRRQQQPRVEGRVVGVDLGQDIPAYCALSDNIYKRSSYGTKEDFLRVREQIQERNRRLQRSLKMAKSGKGREKKLKALERVREREKNFARTYNHFLSKSIVEFAVTNAAEQINLELLQMKETQNKSILRNWSYYQLQQMIEYKAKSEGIRVCYVDPYHTSQACSECGHTHKDNRPNRSKFQCLKCGYEAHADFNAARNIAKSTKYIQDKRESEYYKEKTGYDTYTIKE